MPKITLIIAFLILTSCRSTEMVVNPEKIGIDGNLAIVQGAKDRILEINLSNGKLSSLKKYYGSLDYVAYIKENKSFPLDYCESSIILNNSKTPGDKLIVLFSLDLTRDKGYKIEEYKFNYSSNYIFADSLNTTIPELNFKSVLFYDGNHALVHDLNQNDVKLINLDNIEIQETDISFSADSDQIPHFILTNFFLIDERWIIYIWKKYGKLIVENNQIRIYDIQTNKEYIILETKGIGGPVIKDIDYHKN